MRNRKLTGRWAGFEIRNDLIITPENRVLGPEDLRHMSLTFSIAREWKRMMDEIHPRRRGRPRAESYKAAGVTYLRDILGRRRAEKEKQVLQEAASKPPGPVTMPAVRRRRVR